MKQVNHAEYQELMELFCREFECMEDFTGLKRVTLSTQYPGEWWQSETGGIEAVTKDGYLLNNTISDPDEAKEAYDIDMILCQFMLQRIFKENGIETPYIYPLNLISIDGLIDDAIHLLKMKHRGEDLSGFKFERCLKDIAPYVWKKAPI